MKEKEVYQPILKKCLFELGQTCANVMILPERWMNAKRGFAPYYDYMPHFLLECFFDGEVKPDTIRDLAGTGDLRRGCPGKS